MCFLHLINWMKVDIAMNKPTTKTMVHEDTNHSDSHLVTH